MRHVIIYEQPPITVRDLKGVNEIFFENPCLFIAVKNVALETAQQVTSTEVDTAAKTSPRTHYKPAQPQPLFRPSQLFKKRGSRGCIT